MASSAHFINRREGTRLIGLNRIKGDEYSTCCWAISADDARALVGGWIYLHPAKSEKSTFGGIVRSVELLESGAEETPRYTIFFEAKGEGRGRVWRGAEHAMAWWSGPVDASAPHEGEANA